MPERSIDAQQAESWLEGYFYSKGRRLSDLSEEETLPYNGKTSEETIRILAEAIVQFMSAPETVLPEFLYMTETLLGQQLELAESSALRILQKLEQSSAPGEIADIRALYDQDMIRLASELEELQGVRIDLLRIRENA